MSRSPSLSRSLFLSPSFFSTTGAQQHRLPNLHSFRSPFNSPSPPALSFQHLQRRIWSPSLRCCCSTADSFKTAFSGVEITATRQQSQFRGFPVITQAAVLVVLSVVIVTVIQPAFSPVAYAYAEAASSSGGNVINNELLSSAWTGFLAGWLHTLSGPDHLAALAPLSIGRSRLESAAVGAIWGCGHDAGQVLLGLFFLLFKDQLHIEIIKTWGTTALGLTLLTIGAMGLREASELAAKCTDLGNGGHHSSVIEPADAFPLVKKRIGFGTFVTGIVHGLQPDALMIVLPALALPSRSAGAAFLGMFLLGTVFAMGSYTVFISSCSHALKYKVPRVTEKLTLASSLLAICLGLGILISLFLGFSLY